MYVLIRFLHIPSTLHLTRRRTCTPVAQVSPFWNSTFSSTCWNSLSAGCVPWGLTCLICWQHLAGKDLWSFCPSTCWHLGQGRSDLRQSMAKCQSNSYNSYWFILILHFFVFCDYQQKVRCVPEALAYCFVHSSMHMLRVLLLTVAINTSSILCRIKLLQLRLRQRLIADYIFACVRTHP